MLPALSGCLPRQVKVAQRSQPLRSRSLCSNHVPKGALHRRPRLSAAASEYEGLLSELQGLRSPDELKAWVADHKPRLSLSFLQWMAGLEAQAAGQEQEQLSLLCGQLVAVREGLDPVSHEELQREIEAAAAAEAASSASGQCTSASSQQEGCASNPAAEDQSQVAESLQRSQELGLTNLARQNAQRALTAEGAAAQEIEVAELSDAVEAAKDRALAEVIGRRRLELGQLQEADMAAAAAEHRILDLLMATPDAADRESLLRDAFTPPSDTDFQATTSEEDYLFTTPFRLVQIIRARIKAVQRPEGPLSSLPGLPALSGDAPVHPGGPTHQEVKDNIVQFLQKLDAQVLQYWERSMELT